MSVPSDIESYLTPDEKMVKIGKSRKWEIFITDKRVIFRKGGMFGKEIVEASYRHISSIEYKKHTPWEDIIAGIVAIVLAFFVDDIGSLIISLFLARSRVESLNLGLVWLVFTIFFLTVGIASSVYGVLRSGARYLIHVVGRKPIPLYGKGLEDIIKIIRQYREKVEAEITK